MASFESVLEEIGEFGPYQIRAFVAVGLFEMPAAMAMLVPVFAGATPPWFCEDPDTMNRTAEVCPSDGTNGTICSQLVFDESSFTSIVSQATPASSRSREKCDIDMNQTFFACCKDAVRNRSTASTTDFTLL